MGDPENRIAALEQQVQQLLAVIQQQAATSSTTPATSANPVTVVKHEDARIGRQPETFNGDMREWPTWSFNMRRYIVAIDDTLRQEMDAAEQAPADPIESGFTPEAKVRARKLAYIFTMFSGGGALAKVQNCVEPDNGYMIWRSFLREWEPRVRGRFRVTLQKILNTQFTATESITTQIEAWERLIRDYEQQSGSTVSDDIRAAVLGRSLRGKACSVHDRACALRVGGTQGGRTVFPTGPR